MTTKGRNLIAALFGMLVLTCLFVSPAVPATRSGAAPANAVSTARGTTTLGIGQRESRQHLGTQPRRGSGEQPRWAVGLERPATAGQGPSSFAAVLGAPMLVTPSVAGFADVGDGTGLVSCRAPGTCRDRAPPALALA
jgi:hypothetical protein